MRKKTIFTEHKLDHETGEIKESKWITSQVKNREHFVQMFLEHIALVNKLPHSELKFLMCATKNIIFNTNELMLSKGIKEQISDCTGLKEQTIRVCISRLSKRNILIKKASNWYILNPTIFFYGEEIKRNKLFELTYQWKIK